MPVALLTVRIEGHDMPGPRCGAHTRIEVGPQVRQQFVDRVKRSARGAVWELEVEVKDGGVRGGLSLRGPAVHGRPPERFLYLAWLGRADGQTGPGLGLFRRAKLQLDAVPATLVRRCLRERRPLVARLGLSDACGEPVCASVRPPRIEWSAGDPLPDGGMVRGHHARPAPRGPAHRQPPRPVRGRGDR